MSILQKVLSGFNGNAKAEANLHADLLENNQGTVVGFAETLDDYTLDVLVFGYAEDGPLSLSIDKRDVASGENASIIQNSLRNSMSAGHLKVVFASEDNDSIGFLALDGIVVHNDVAPKPKVNLSPNSHS